MKWISVEERLPGEGGRYWCYVEEITCLGISHYQWNRAYSELHGFDVDELGCKVTHWMPLPDPPKEISK